MTATLRESGQLSSLLAATSPLPISATVVRRRPWASALFAGVRLTIAIGVEDDSGLDEWLATVPELNLPLRGHFVADADVVERSTNGATIELLLIESD